MCEGLKSLGVAIHSLTLRYLPDGHFTRDDQIKETRKPLFLAILSGNRWLAIEALRPDVRQGVRRSWLGSLVGSQRWYQTRPKQYVIVLFRQCGNKLRSQHV